MKSGLGALAFLLFTGLAPLHATETVNGRWAADGPGCEGGFFSGGSPLVVTNYAVRWQGETCRIARMYKAGPTYYIQALCWEASGDRSIPVSLTPHGRVLSVTWNRAHRADLRRCD